MTLNTVLKSEFGLSNCKVKILNGYANKNYLVTAEEGRFIFKTYSDYRRLFEISKAENQLLLHLHAKKIADIPKPIAFNDGSFAKIIDIEGQENLCRLLTFVDGTFMADVPLTNAMVSSLGTYVATLDRALFDFDHMTLRARESNWDLQYALNNKKYIKDIPSVRKQNLVNYFIQQYEQQVLPELPELRKSCIHGDFNEWNILLNDQTVSGVIDFGDCGHTHLINELAITATYVFYAAKDPLAFAEPLLQSYHAILPLQEKEISILYWLIAMRLCTSVCNSAHAKVSDPDNSYASVSEQKAWALLEKWLRIGPNRAEQIFRAAVGFDVIKTESLETALGRRKKYLSNILSVSYHRPIVMHRAAFQYMFDAQGASFLDAYNNIPHVGHQHPMVVEAAKKQLTQLNTNTRYLYDLLPDYAERLLAKFPNSLNKVFFVNSGSAASDLAIRLSMNHTKSRNLMVMEHGYHGNTQIGIDISDYKFNNPKGQGQPPHIFKTTLPDTYRGKYTQDDGTAGKAYAQEALQKIEKNSESLAAFISEPIVGCGGQIPLAKDYLKPIYAAIRAQGGICISDEVQTGFGRLGDVFWGFEHQGVVPDIVVLGKPMGNGHPIGAVVTTDEIAASFEDGVEFFSSFGGNPVSCAIGMAVLEVIDKEGLQKNAHEVGNYYQDCLKDLKTRYPVIGDVRGSGLFLGIDIVKPGTRDPDTALAHHLKNALREQYVLVSTDGPADNVIKSKPPLCFTKDNVDEVVEKMATILSAYGT